jgi:hypothetical protein
MIVPSSGGARRQPDLNNKVDGTAAERPQDFLRPSVNDGVQTELNA